MISPVFVLCSALLLTSALADSSFDKKALKDNAKKAGFGLLADILGGKDIQQALTERSMEVAGSVGNDYGSAMKSGLKRMKELQDGQDVDAIAANIGKAILEKNAGKIPALDGLLKLVGDDNVKNLMGEGAKALTNLFG